MTSVSFAFHDSISAAYSVLSYAIGIIVWFDWNDVTLCASTEGPLVSYGLT